MPGQNICGLLKRGLELRYLPAVLAGLAFVIMLPALKAGWGPMDDLRHRVKLVEGSQLPERLLETGMVPENSGKLSTVLSELHSSVHTKTDTTRLKDYGVLPWWTRNDYRASNWRPLDSFTHWLDYRLFANSAAMMHVHNLLWFAAVIALVAILYRQLMVPAWTAGLAALLYFLDDSNFFPAMWIANRCLLLSVVFAILTVFAHHRWRQHHSLAAAIVAPVCLLGSLLSTEAGIATFAYLFAYALIVDRASWVRRGLSLVPAVLVIVLWRAVYSALGHGAYSSGFVIDPGAEPLRFAWAVLVRGPILLMAQWSPLPAEMFSFIYWREQVNAWEVSVGSLVMIFFIFLPLLRNNRVARFWFTAMLLSVIPICASLPMNRNLLFVAIGAFGLIAQFVAALEANENWLPKNWMWQVTARVLLFMLLLIHVVLAGVGRIAQPKITGYVQSRFESTMQVGPLAGVENQDVVIVNAPNPFSLFYLPPFRAHHSQPLPRAIRILVPGFGPFEITRTDAHTILLKVKSGNFLSYQTRADSRFVYLFKHFNDVFRDKRFPFQVREKVVLPGLTVEVVAVDKGGQPTQVSFRFAVSLDDPTLKWLQWDWQQNSYAPFDVPEVGQSCEIAGPPR
jgi:hypothetical protein